MQNKQTQSGYRFGRLQFWTVAFIMGVVLSPLAIAWLSNQAGPVSLVSHASAQADPPADPPADAPATPTLPALTNDNSCPKGQCIIDKYVQPSIDTAAALVGVAVTISIIVGGIQYATSADNPQKVSAAKQRIVTSIFVLIGFFLFFAFLNYIIPGGLV